MTQKEIPYHLAARFANKQVAGPVYNTVQELIYTDVDCDLSVYRIRINNVWHVIVIGEKPSDSLHVQIEAQLTNGTLVTLESSILRTLMDRRSKAIQLGPWVEGHYPEGKELPNGDN